MTHRTTASADTGTGTGTGEEPDGGVPARTLVLAAGTFAVGTDAFVVAGVLPEIARDLHVSIAAAGQLVTVFSIAYTVLSPVTAALTGTWPRRRVLLTALAVLIAGNAATALAPAYGWVLASRALAAAGAAMFTPTAGATAAALAGPAHRARALSYVSVGLVSSTALGVPAGTLLGTVMSWRGTIWFVTALAALAAAGVALWLPRVPAPPAVSLRGRLAPLGDRRVNALLASTTLLFVGIYLVHSYVSVIFEPVTGDSGRTLALLLFTFGCTGIAGNLITGVWADRIGPRRVITGVSLVLAADLALLPAIGTSLAGALAVVAVYGFTAWGVMVPQQHRLIAVAPSAAALVVSLNASSIYLAVSLAGALGALSLRITGTSTLVWTAAAFVLAGLAVSEIAHRTTARGNPAHML
ncbi:MFS transporter [Actinomadura rubrisoli]|uniref:MFS transporter n=1 Tax=Actinomadura rubrisoli TaxID=2530368 RepID=A0A4V2YRU5_9ACTN|nr:MFS transporter [Actinomadura rubrisoli]TDD67677.1 MFS transporter [Actinomadura rubrisoli]